MVEKEDGNLYVGAFADVDATVNPVGWLIPINLRGRDGKALALSAVAVFNRKRIPVQNHSYPMKRVAMPRHGLAGRKLHAADIRCSALEEGFIFQLDRLRSLLLVSNRYVWQPRHTPST